MKATHHRVAQLLLILTGLFSITSLSEAQSPKPYYLACTKGESVQIRAIDESRSVYKLVATWKAPSAGHIYSVYPSPSSRKLLVSYVNDPGNQEPTYGRPGSTPSSSVVLDLRDTSQMTVIDLGRTGTGRALLSPSGDVVAVVDEGGVIGYIDIKRGRRDVALQEPEVSSFSELVTYDCGQQPNGGAYGILFHYRSFEQESFPDSVASFFWRNDKLLKRFTFENPESVYTPAIKQDGTFYVPQEGLVYQQTSSGKVGPQIHGFSALRRPSHMRTDLHVVKDSIGEDVLINWNGEIIDTAQPSKKPNKILRDISSAINVGSNGRVAIATESEVQFGTLRSGEFKPSASLKGAFSRITYLGPIAGEIVLDQPLSPATSFSAETEEELADLVPQVAIADQETSSTSQNPWWIAAAVALGSTLLVGIFRILKFNHGS